MSCHSRVIEWTTVIRTHLPQLSMPQARVLALWSLGMVLARSCALTAVSRSWPRGCSARSSTVRQQLRELCYEAARPNGGPASSAGRGDPALCRCWAGC